jgi:hypothetical protein
MDGPRRVVPGGFNDRRKITQRKNWSQALEQIFLRNKSPQLATIDYICNSIEITDVIFNLNIAEDQTNTELSHERD